MTGEARALHERGLALVRAVRAGQDLPADEAGALCELLLEAGLTAHEGAEILVALADKGETADEVFGFARALLGRAAAVPFTGDTVDTCGTGGSGLVRFNTSTAAAFVAAAAGVCVAKHGNRGSRVPNGSFDLLSALGIPIELDGPRVAECLERTGLGFLLAPLFHPVMKQVVPARKLAARRTIFNLAAPLCNPTHPARQVVGAATERDARTVARCLELLGRRAFCCVTGHPGLDEVSISGVSQLFGATGVPVEVLEPSALDLPPIRYEALPGGDASVNAPLFLELVQGRAHEGIEQLVALSSALLLRTAGAVPSLGEGMRVARELLRSGEARGKLEHYRRVARELAH